MSKLTEPLSKQSSLIIILFGIIIIIIGSFLRPVVSEDTSSLFFGIGGIIALVGFSVWMTDKIVYMTSSNRRKKINEVLHDSKSLTSQKRSMNVKQLESKVTWRLVKALYVIVAVIYSGSALFAEYEDDTFVTMLSRAFVFILTYFILRRVAIYVLFGSQKEKI
jgi:hypothetical protein